MNTRLRSTVRTIASSCIALLPALCTCSCVDNDFQIDDVNQEVTIGTEGLTLPLGYVEEKSLDEIIGTNISELTTDADGNYSLGYTGNGSFTIDGISDRGFSSGSDSVDTGIDYPDMTITNTEYTVDKTVALKIPDALKSLSNPVLPAELHPSLADNGTLEVDFDLSIPQQIKSVDKIYVGDDERGTPFAITFAFNGLAPINGGGEARLTITAPEGCEFWNGTDSASAGASVTVTRTIADGATTAEFPLWLRSIDTSDLAIENGKMRITEQVKWSISYDFTAKAGKRFTPADAPSLHMQAALKYRDADVTLNSFSIDDTVRRLEENILIQNIIKEVRCVAEIVLKNTRVTLRITGVDWLSDAIADAANVKIGLPKMFVLEQLPGLQFDENGYIDTDIKQLREGLTIGLSKIVIDEGVGTPDADGRISLDFVLDVVMGNVKEDIRLKASELLHNGKVSIGISFLDTTFYIESIAGKVAYSATQHTTIDMSDIAKYDITVGDIDVSPLLRFAIDNPFSVPIDGMVELVPYKNGAAIAENTVTVRGVAIAAATRTDSAHTDVVIAQADRRGEFPSAQFIEADITQLFKGTMPDKIDVKVAAGTDSEQEFTIYAKEQYDVTYDYGVDIPLRFGKQFSLAYSETIDLDGAFDDITDSSITIGDITVVATVLNSTPLDFRIGAQMLDENGRPTEAQVLLDEDADTAFGSTDGKARESKVVMRLSLGEENNLQRLVYVKSLRLTLTASSPEGSAGDVALNKNQTLSAILQLKIDGGITANPDDL